MNRDGVGCRYDLTNKLNFDQNDKKKATLVAKCISLRYAILITIPHLLQLSGLIQ